jgi:hypothetical protein
MACATLILPFLPMLPVQILLNNLLYDLSELALPFDHVDEEALAKPSPATVVVPDQEQAGMRATARTGSAH